MVETTRPEIESPQLSALDLLPIRTQDAQLAPLVRAIEENFRRIGEVLRDQGGRAQALELLASMVGGAWITADVNASTASGDDVRIPHGLGRVPSLIVLQCDSMGTAGLLYGVPDGGDPAAGQNENPWTSEALYLRATVSSRYQLVVV